MICFTSFVLGFSRAAAVSLSGESVIASVTAMVEYWLSLIELGAL